MPDCKKCSRNLSLPNKNNPKCAICSIAPKKNDITKELSKLKDLKGKDYSNQLKTITEMNVFKRHPELKRVFWTENNNDPDLKNLLACAGKLTLDKNTMVYILPNPGSIKTGDYIVVRKNIFKDYDLKTISGKRSAGNRLIDSIGQSRRVILNMTTEYNPRILAKDVKTYFESNRNAVEVLILKNKKQVIVHRKETMERSFFETFLTKWNK